VSATDARWTCLKLGVHPVLDWCETAYTAARLTEMADAVGKNPHPIQTRTPEGLPGVWDPAIEQVLRALAASPAALKTLNRRGTTPPYRVKGLNRAVHFHVQVALYPRRKRAAILADVGGAWGVTAGHIKDDVTRFLVDGGDPRVRCAEGVLNAPFFVEQIIAQACHRGRRTRGQALKNFDADMCARGGTEVQRKK